MRTRKETLINAARAQLKKFFKTCSISAPPFWDGKAAERIVEILAKEQKSGARIQNTEYRIELLGGGGESLKSLGQGYEIAILRDSQSRRWSKG